MKEAIKRRIGFLVKIACYLLMVVSIIAINIFAYDIIGGIKFTGQQYVYFWYVEGVIVVGAITYIVRRKRMPGIGLFASIFTLIIILFSIMAIQVVQEARINAVKEDLGRIQNALELHKKHYGYYPENYKELLSIGYLTDGDDVDPWGNAFRYEALHSKESKREDNYLLGSNGPDQKPDTKDDIEPPVNKENHSFKNPQKTDLPAVQANDSNVFSESDEERILKEIFKVDKLIKKIYPPGKLRDGNMVYDYDLFRFCNAGGTISIEGGEVEYPPELLHLRIKSVESGYFTGKDKREKLVVLQLSGLSGAALSYRYKFVVYSCDLSRKISDIIEENDYIEYYLLKGKEKDHVLFYKCHSTSGGGEEHGINMSFMLFGWDSAGKGTSKNIYESSFTRTKKDTEKTEKQRNPVFKGNNFTIDGKRFIWNAEKEDFEIK